MKQLGGRFEHMCSRFTTKATHVPLYRLLSKLGLATREQGKVLVSSGKVQVDDRVVLDPEWWAPRQSVITVEGAHNRVTFDGTMRCPPPACLLMMHKKRGIVVAREDAKNKVVCDHPAIKNRFPSCLPVGRLDQSSEGLLLFTNDTQLAHRILSPQSHLVKTYHVRIDRPLASEELAALGTDVDLGGELTLPSTWTSMTEQRNPNWVSVQLREGKHRQIRRMLAELGVGVQRLVRVAIGPLQLGTLPRGDVRELTDTEVSDLRRDTSCTINM